MSTVSAGVTLPSITDGASARVVPADESVALLRLDVAALDVPKAGRVAVGSVTSHIVLDPEGREILWLTECLSWLGAQGLSRETQTAYARGALRAFRPLWAAGIDPRTIGPLGYSVARRWLVHCHDLGPAYRPTHGSAVRYLSNSTLIQTQSALASIYDALVLMGAAESNPVTAFRDTGMALLAAPTHERTYDTSVARYQRTRGRIAKHERKVIVTLNDEQSATLRSAERLRDRALWTLLLDSGPRISEALSMDLDNYMPGSNIAWVVGKGLGGARRPIPLADATVAVIGEYIDELARHGLVLGPHDPIFRTLRQPHRPLTYMGAWKALRRALRDRRVHPHALRHTAATEMLALLDGTEADRLRMVKEMLGHSQLETTRRYLHQDMAATVTDHVAARARGPRPAPPQIAAVYDNPHMRSLLRDIRNEEQ